MAKIVKTNDQEIALKTINESLKVISRTNAVITAAEGVNELTVTMAAGNEKAAMLVPAADALKFLADIRKAKVASVRSLSRKYAIELDDADQEILSGGKKPEVKEPATVAEPESETAYAETDSSERDAEPTPVEPEAEYEPESQESEYETDGGFWGA